MVNRPFLLAVVGALALACRHNDKSGTSFGTDGSLAQNDAAASSDEAMPPPRAIPEQEGTMRRGRRDPTSLFMRAASMLSVNYARQTTLEGVQARLASDETKLTTAFDTLRTDLVADIRRGTLNAARLKNDEAAIERAAQALTSDEAEGLNAVHAACDPVERKTVVDHVRFLPGAREALGAGPQDSDRGNREDRNRRRLDKMTADLDLDEEQQSKVVDIEPDAHSTTSAERDARQKRLQALLAAFTTDSFDARPIMVSKESSAAHDMAHREVVLVSRLLPVLRPPQREKLAESVGSRRLGHGRGDAGTVVPFPPH